MAEAVRPRPKNRKSKSKAKKSYVPVSEPTVSKEEPTEKLQDSKDVAKSKNAGDNPVQHSQEETKENNENQAPLDSETKTVEGGRESDAVDTLQDTPAEVLHEGAEQLPEQEDTGQCLEGNSLLSEGICDRQNEDNAVNDSNVEEEGQDNKYKESTSTNDVSGVEETTNDEQCVDANLQHQVEDVEIQDSVEKDHNTDTKALALSPEDVPDEETIAHTTEEENAQLNIVSETSKTEDVENSEFIAPSKFVERHEENVQDTCESVSQAWVLEVDSGHVSTTLEPDAVVQENRSIEINQIPDHRMMAPAFAEMTFDSRSLFQETPIIPLLPFTSEELKMFYFNPELEHVEDFMDQFIQTARNPRNEFSELVETYMKSRVSQVKLEQDIKQLQQSCKDKLGDIWGAKTIRVTAEGKCRDGYRLSHTFTSEIAEYHQDAAVLVSGQMKDIRSSLHEDYQLKAYNSQMARIRIESYIHDVFTSSLALKNATSEDRITCRLPQEMAMDDIKSLVAIQECTSVLFSFKRMGLVEKEFNKDVDEWLERMVGALQRAGALPDHFFILNHMLRCPPGSVTQLSHFLQFPSFFSPSQAVYETWSSPLLHHFVIMLATLTLPIKLRKEFLAKYKENMKPATSRSISWLLVDEEREEDESPEESWCLLQENDLSAVFEQFPFEELLQYLLKMSKSGESVSYDVTASNSNDIMHVLAFSTNVVTLLGEVFDIFNLLRYRQFLKRVSRTIRLIVQVVSDHWCQYRNWRAEICGDSYHELPHFITITQQFNLTRLQLEFDEFFLKSTKGILDSHSFGVCQFLSCMPYDAISTDAASTVLTMLTGEQRGNSVSRRKPTLSAQGNRPALSKTPSPSDTIFLLTALSNLAISRPSEDKQFIKASVDHLLEISFLDETTKDNCLKTGKELLASVADKHPFTISHILARIEKNIDKFDKDAVALFKSLPLEIWEPTISDLELVRCWLLRTPLTSVQHMLCRYILSSLNYGTVVKNGRVVLFLDRSVHCAIAITLVEVVGFCLPDAPGGIQDLRGLGNDIISQVSRMAYSSYNKIVNAQVQQDLVNWAFETALMLKIHETDLIPLNSDEDNVNLLISVDENDGEDPNTDSWFAAVTKVFSKLSGKGTQLTSMPELLNINIAIRSQGALACYVALSLTEEGHSIDLFAQSGLNKLLTIVSAGKMDAALRVLGSIFPAALDAPDLLKSDERFIRILDALVHIDANRAGYTEKLWQYLEPGIYSQKFASVIVNSILIHDQRNSNYVLDAVSLWLEFLASLRNWPKDCCVQFLMDSVIKVAFTYEGGLELSVNVLDRVFTNMLDGYFAKGFLSSVMSWISSGNTLSPLSASCHPDFSYYAYAILSMETLMEEKAGLWRELTAELLFDDKVPLDVAYKKATSHVKAPYLPPLHNLSIYRWAEQGMASNTDHPLLPILWQQFFRLFFQKPSEESGLSNRHGIGHKFFQSFTYSSMAKKMKSHLMSTASYHQDKGKEKEEEEGETRNQETSTKDHIHTQDFHSKLGGFYHTLALWLDEPRLHDPSLLLTALPDAYQPDLLNELFLGSKSPWLRFVNSECISKEIDALASLWKAVTKPQCKHRALVSPEDVLTQPTTGQKMLRRLSFDGNGKPAASLPPVAPPVPEISPQLLLTRPRLVQDLSGELERVVQYSKRVSSLLASHVALDEEYNELIRDLYENIDVPKVASRPCKELSRCKGEAKLICKIKEKTLNNRVFTCLENNRVEWERLIDNGLQPSPHNLCTGAVYVENVITQLLNTLKYANPQQQATLSNAGIHLFYLLAELIDSDVKRCNPAIQFFSSCVERLGETFIATNPEEQLHLLKTIFHRDESVSFLAPHFFPNGVPPLFVDLYGELANSVTIDNVTSVFVVVSKFDVKSWLKADPPYTDREVILRASLCGISTFGSKPDDSVSLVLDQFRGHFTLVLNYRFPELYLSTLQGLLHMSADKNMCPIVWSDFLASIGSNLPGHRLPVKVQKVQVGMNEVDETVERLKCFFIEAYGARDCSISQMYQTWKTYLPAFAALYSFLFNKYLVYKLPLTRNKHDVDMVLKGFWLRVLDLYSMWILPNANGSEWLIENRQEATIMIHSFIEVMRNASEQFASSGNTYLLNCLWCFYAEEIVSKLSTNEGALNIYHSLFLRLPWKYFCPEKREIALFLDVSSNSTVSFRYLSKVFYELNWIGVLGNYYAREDKDSQNSLNFFLDQLLKIILMMSSDAPLIKATKENFFVLAKTVSSAPWYRLELAQVKLVCQWFSETCDSTEVLNDSSAVTAVIKLLKIVCGIQQRSSQQENVFLAKRTAYVRSIVTLLVRASSLSKSSPNSFRLVVSKLLDEIDKTVAMDTEGTVGDLVDICTALLSLLNNFPPGPGLDAIRSAIHDYMPQTTRKEVVLAFISACSRAIANLAFMSDLLECAIEGLFSKFSDPELPGAWRYITDRISIPELDRDKFLQETLSKGNLLLLYAYNSQRWMQGNLTSVAELHVLMETVQWCSKLVPSPSIEYKITLMVFHVLQIAKDLSQKSSIEQQAQQVAKCLLFLCHACQQMSEEKTYGGFLGMIGIGRRSELSPSFRIFARSIQGFVLAQMPSSSIALRTQPDSPGSMRGGGGIPPTGEAEKCFVSLETLARNKQYSAYKEQIKWVVQFITNPRNCIQDGPTFSAYLMKELFYRNNAVMAVALEHGTK